MPCRPVDLLGKGINDDSSRCSTQRVHVDRTARCHCHYCRPHRPAAAGGAEASLAKRASRAKCANNLKQFGLAMHSFHDAAQSLARWFPGESKSFGMLSWIEPEPPSSPVPIRCSFFPYVLPYMEQNSLPYSLYNFNYDFSNSVNLPAIQTKIPTQQCCVRHRICPNLSGPVVGAGDYKSNYGLNWGRYDFVDQGGPSSNPAPFNVGTAGRIPLLWPTGARFMEISDGLSNTLLMLEMLQPLELRRLCRRNH